jgi:hypothetical protein
MGEVTGPINTLPGASHHVPDGTVCDNHPDRPAVARIQGETDSFGSELWDCCEQCRDELRAYRRSPEARSGKCDWCKEQATDLRDRRDIDEGSYGPVYRICKCCDDKYQAELQRELEAWDDRYGDWD